MGSIKNEGRYCPVCGYELESSPWVGDSASYEICPCCGIQFGYDDAQYGEDASKQRNAVYCSWRGKWIRDGMPWFSKGTPRPEDWNPSEQLKRVQNE